ncbi:hypothetical protein CRM22_003343 [Opisthorchis felineus]|uniref:Kinesin motor domain-containing protein n=1 Tax=Opisthorchis felineus TaxID=147828 RepID=A0A4S2M1T2_OPIFE|nr:hypothetical protein CRM22_003343 [Opisthorchis felineus]
MSLWKSTPQSLINWCTDDQSNNERSPTQEFRLPEELHLPFESTELLIDNRHEILGKKIVQHFERSSRSVPPSPVLLTSPKLRLRSRRSRTLLGRNWDRNNSTNCVAFRNGSPTFSSIPPTGHCESSTSLTPSSNSHSETFTDRPDSVNFPQSTDSYSSQCYCSRGRRAAHKVKKADASYGRHLNESFSSKTEFLSYGTEPTLKNNQDLPSTAKDQSGSNVNIANGLIQQSTAHTQLSPPQLTKYALDDCSSSVVWPTPVPVKSVNASQFTGVDFETIDLFKYRRQYPSLLGWMQNYLQYFDQQLLSYSSLPAKPVALLTETSDSFIQDVLRKRKKRMDSFTLIEQGKFTSRSMVEIDNVPNYDVQRNQLWKRRYHSLLNAIDLVYKDHQLLYYVSREGLFECVSTAPAIPAIPFPRGSKLPTPQTLPSHTQLCNGAADPASQLSERVTQLLIRMGIQETRREDLHRLWPCSFLISVGFLSDVIAQRRILRTDLDRRLALRDRLLYVLRQAREQRSMLKQYAVKQRELLTTLTDKLEVVRRRHYPVSPIQDQPSSIDDGLVNNIDSPFVDCGNVESEMTNRISLPIENSSDISEPVKTELDSNDQQGVNYRHRHSELQQQIAILERVLKEEETRRKRLHNRIQELTGNIRVFCRLRPEDSELPGNGDSTNPLKPYLRVSSDDKLLFCSETLRELLPTQSRAPWSKTGCAARTLPNTAVTATPSGIYANMVGSPKCFIFDRAFGPSSTQDDVYQEVDDLIISCIDGYNVCIMAYGQTGSGKTYTMMGTPDNPGVNRRAIRSLFERCNKRKQWAYSIWMSMVEIYQEDVFDLLGDALQKTKSAGSESKQLSPSRTQSTSREQQQVNSDTDKWKQSTPRSSWANRPSSSTLGFSSGRPVRRRGSVRIMSNNLDGVVLQNLLEREVHNEEETFHYLELAEKQRRVGATRLNICSSRSHLVILLKINGENKFHLTTSRGSLTLADLAGSENVTKSGSTGERFIEAACINKSLSSLGRVFDALRRQQKPAYRETKLTYLLRPNLGGESKCLLFVALRTEPEHAEETWRAINFGQGALQVVPGGNDPSKTRGGDNQHSEASLLSSIKARRTAHPPLFRCIAPNRKAKEVRQGSKLYSGGTGYLPQAVYSMGPAITKQGWK